MNEKKPKNHLRALRIVLMVALQVLIVGCVVYLGYRFYSDWRTEQALQLSNQLYQEALVNNPPTPSVTAAEPASTPTPVPTTAQPTVTPQPSAPAAAPKVLQPAFAALRSQYGNNDIVGYLKIEGTSIDYLVTQYTDNDFYLTHDINKNPSNAGWPFMDFDDNITKDERSIIIYGHNMKSDTMFHALRYWQDKSYYEKHKYITFNTAYDNMDWEIFAFVRTDTDFYYIQTQFPDDASFMAVVDGLRQRALYDTGVQVTAQDRILLLSTCTDVEENTRYVLCARLMTPDEARQKMQDQINTGSY